MLSTMPKGSSIREITCSSKALDDTKNSTQKYNIIIPAEYSVLIALARTGWTTYLSGIFLKAFANSELPKEDLRVQILGVMKLMRSKGLELSDLPCALKANCEAALKLKAIRV